MRNFARRATNRPLPDSWRQDRLCAAAHLRPYSDIDIASRQPAHTTACRCRQARWQRSPPRRLAYDQLSSLACATAPTASATLCKYERATVRAWLSQIRAHCRRTAGRKLMPPSRNAVSTSPRCELQLVRLAAVRALIHGSTSPYGVSTWVATLGKPQLTTEFEARAVGVKAQLSASRMECQHRAT